MVMDVKLAPTKSLTVFRSAIGTPVGKSRESPGLGATSPTQFLPVVHLLSGEEPPVSGAPSQMNVAGASRSSSCSIHSRKREGLRAMDFPVFLGEIHLSH